MTDEAREAAGAGAALGAAEEPIGDLARDWRTLWQSELAALAVDREAQEAWQALAKLWVGPAGARRNDAATGSAGAATPTRPAPAAAAPDPRDAAIEHLGRRVAELEQRLAELERQRLGELERRRRRSAGKRD